MLIAVWCIALLVICTFYTFSSKRIVALSTVIANETADHDMEEVIPAQEETSSASRLEGSSQNAKYVHMHVVRSTLLYIHDTA